MEEIISHLSTIIENGTDRYGPVETPMWLSVLDTRSGRPPETVHTPARVYRLIGAPQGSTLYWDQPLIVAAFELSRLSGQARFSAAADRYIASFLEHCVDDDGMFQWGNHQYYDVYKDEIVKFHQGYHELRPFPAAWTLFWKHDSALCERYMRRMLERHVYDKQTGGFNRHDDGMKNMAFIESGGILVESAAWLYAQTGDASLLDMALRIARYSFSHRGKETNLVRNQPDYDRWDAKVSTTEVGVWAQSLLRAYAHSGDSDFVEMAATSVEAYLKYGYDEVAQRFYGQLDVESGRSVVPEKPGYWPGEYSDPWNIDQWPTHDYPMALAEAALGLYRLTGASLFRLNVERWAQILSQSSPVAEGRKTYAENYGRAIHFLTGAGRELLNDACLERARALQDEAIEQLYDKGMFQGFPGTHFYESVDGTGFLCLALIELEAGESLDYYGLGF